MQVILIVKLLIMCFEKYYTFFSRPNRMAKNKIKIIVDDLVIVYLKSKVKTTFKNKKKIPKIQDKICSFILKC